MSWTAWKFETSRFCVKLIVTEDFSYRYDGDDEDGETQAALESGEFVAFDSLVTVTLDGQLIGCDSLGGSVYASSAMSDFWTAHRDSLPMNRNCSLMRARQGENVSICHYFPDMVRSAVAEARKHLCNVPKLRCAA